MSPGRPIFCTYAFLLTLLASLLLALPVAAHQDLERAEPGFDAVLDVPPTVVMLWFAGELDSFESTVAVYDVHNRQIDLGDASINHENRRLLQVSLPGNLRAGKYAVRWMAVDDEDAHPIHGEYTFTIAGAPEETKSNPVFVVSIGVVIVASGSGNWVWVRRRRHS